MKPAVNIDEITEKILRETDYLEAATDNGYPQYTEEEAVTGAEALERKEELEMLQSLTDGEDLFDIYYANIGEALDRLEESQMIERPSTGPEYVKATRLSRTYLMYYGKMEELR